MRTLAERLHLALDRIPGATQGDLAKHCGVKPPSVSDWFTGKTKTLKAKSYRLAAEFLQCRQEWLETGRGDPGWSLIAGKVPDPPGRGLAQDMSQYRITVAPQPIAWEQLTVDKDQLPNTFTLALPDDALTPRLRRGDQVELNRALAAEPGDLVLVRDGAGQHYVREYRRHRPDDWTAAALNGAYTSLVASQDQLEIIAVVEWERRGRHRD